MAMLLSLKDDDVFNALASLDKIHNSIIPAWTMYEAKRSSIAQQGENHTFDGSDGKGQFDVTRGSHLEAMMFEVEAVATELVRRAQQDFAEANDALSKLVPLLNDRLQLGVNVTGTSGPEVVTRNDAAKQTDGADSLIPQREAAGMSEGQQVTAIPVANVPAGDFERQLKATRPDNHPTSGARQVGMG